MLLLAISTSTPTCSVAIGSEDAVIASAELAKPHSHNEFLTPAIAFCAQQAGLSINNVTGVVVDVGPGLFTGLRVGIATAKTIATTLQVPMIAFSSLDLLAFSARLSSARIVPVLDARRSEVFTASYRAVPGGVVRLSDPRVCSPEALADDLLASGDEVLLLGDGVQKYGPELTVDDRITVGDADLQFPSAGAAIALARERFVREEFLQPAQVTPMYLRKSDAELNWGRLQQQDGQRVVVRPGSMDPDSSQESA